MTPSQPRKTVYLIRHGQSVDNVAPVFQSVNVQLSETGQQQAAQMAERVSKLSFEALISSPLMRARQTAEAIAAKTGKDITFSDLFVERIKPSSIDGKPWADRTAEAMYRKWDDSLYDTDAKVEDGENYQEITSRADEALAYLLNRPEERLVVVTHGHFMRTMLARILLDRDLTGPILRRIQQVMSVENTGITVINYKDAYDEVPRWRLWTHNDHAHFAE